MSSSGGERNLDCLLATMEPTLREESYVFCSISNKSLTTLSGLMLTLDPLSVYKEHEGFSLILQESKVQELDSLEVVISSPYRCITLTVHSSLEAVGLTAALARVLADKGISANVVAAYYHDHIFVPALRANEAVEALLDLQRRTEASLQEQQC